jgi:acyl-coenzyme A synthetase/AMP-(fatty) acid ligase
LQPPARTPRAVARPARLRYKSSGRQSPVNIPAAGAMNNWFDHILFQIRTRAEQPAIVMEDRAVTYGMLGAGIERCARRIAGLGIARGEPAALLVQNPLRHLTLALALHRIGIPSLSLEHNQAGIAEIKLATVLGDAAARGLVKPGARVIEVTDEWFSQEPPAGAALPEPFAGSQQVCRLSLTSGTTGAPKILSHTVADVGSRAMSFIGLDWRVVLCMLGLSTNFGFTTDCAALAYGRTLCLAESPYQAIRMIELFSIDFILLSTEQLLALTRVARKTNAGLSSLRNVWIGGEIPTRALLESASLHVCKDILNRYGASELGLIARSTARELLANPGLAGHVVPGIEVSIVDPAGNRCPPGRPGFVMARRTGDGADKAPWSDLGDVGWIAPDGQLFVIGRTSDLGPPGAAGAWTPQASPVHEIEHLLRLEWDVTDAAAVLVEDAQSGARPQAWVGVVDNRGADAARLEAIARARGIDCAVRLVELKAIPRGLNGKVIRGQLKAAIEAATAGR